MVEVESWNTGAAENRTWLQLESWQHLKGALRHSVLRRIYLCSLVYKEDGGSLGACRLDPFRLMRWICKRCATYKASWKGGISEVSERLLGVQSRGITPGHNESSSSQKPSLPRSILAEWCVCAPGEGPRVSQVWKKKLDKWLGRKTKNQKN